jgi:hypothetical protein
MNGISSIKTVLEEYREKGIFPEIINGYHGINKIFNILRLFILKKFF